jgi:hypothetical protein
MSAAFFPQIEGDNHGITSAVDGKALARSSELLDALIDHLRASRQKARAKQSARAAVASRKR